jgi:hypothetical protein
LFSKQNVVQLVPGSTDILGREAYTPFRAHEKGSAVLALQKATSFVIAAGWIWHVEVFRVTFLLAAVAVVGCEAESGIDYGMNSANVGEHLRRDEDYPFVGFWKLHPSDNSGLVINASKEGTYTVWSCSPRGSTETWLSPTTLVGDENFNVIDENTIEVADKNGDFQTYVRFE